MTDRELRDGLLEDFHEAGMFLDGEVVPGDRIHPFKARRRPTVVFMAAGLFGFAFGSIGAGLAWDWRSGTLPDGRVLGPDTVYVYPVDTAVWYWDGSSYASPYDFESGDTAAWGAEFYGSWNDSLSHDGWHERQEIEWYPGWPR